MPSPTLSLLQYLRISSAALREDTRTDAELLSRYVQLRDETAFAALVVRHGPLVANVCRQILGDTHDVEDAFQIAFLALSRQADHIHVHETLAGWLHQVARRAAVNVRKAAGSRKKLADRLQKMVRPVMSQDIKQKEDYDSLHEELAELPQKLRISLVLYYLEGKTQVEVAQILGVTERAVQKWLARGRSILERRLTQRGITAGAATLVALFEGAAAKATTPIDLVRRTVGAALAFRAGTLNGSTAELARQVLQSLSYGTGWWVLKGWLVALVCASGLGAGAIVWRAASLPMPRADADSPPVVAPAKEVSSQRGENEASQVRLDAYGDSLPDRALARLGTLRLRNTGGTTNVGSVSFLERGIRSALFSSDGKTLFTLGDENPLRLWDVSTGKLLRQWDTPQQFKQNATIILSPAKNTLALRQEDKVSLWDITTGKSRPLSSNSSAAALIFSTDGKTLTTVGRDRHIRVWEVASGKELHKHVLAADSKADTRVFVFSPDGKRLVTIDNNSDKKMKMVQLWEVATGQRLHQLTETKDAILPHQNFSNISFSPDGRLLAIANSDSEFDGKQTDGVVYLWDVAIGKEVRRLGSDEAGTWSVAFSPDGKLLATGSGAGPIRLWEVATGKELRSCQGYCGHITSLAFSHDGKLLASGASGNDYTARIWEVATGKEVGPRFGGHTSAVLSVNFSPDGKSLISGGRDGTIGLWHAETGRERHTPLRAGDFQSPAALSPDGKTIVSIGTTFTPNGKPLLFGALASPSIIRFWDATTGQKRHQLADSVGFSQSITFSSDGKALLSPVCGAPAPNLRLWDIATGKNLCHIVSNMAVNTGSISAAFSPQGKTFAVLFSEDAILTLCNVATGKRVCQYQAHSNGGVCLTFSADGQMLATAGKDTFKEDNRGTQKDTIHLWRIPRDNPWIIETAAETVSTLVGHTDSIYALAFSPDGKTLASAGKDGTLRLWEVAAGKERRCFKGHEGEIWCLAFAPDGRRLASGSNDTTILIWDVTGRLGHGRLHPARLSTKQVEQLWNDLASTDAECAGQAIWMLTSAPEQAVPFFKKHIQPVPVDKRLDQRIAQLVGELDDNSFKVRKKAADELQKLGGLAEPALHQAMKPTSSVEVKKRVSQLLSLLKKKQTAPPAELRRIRALEVLEQCRTQQARQLLEELSQGASGALLTQDAQAILKRWSR